MIGITDLTADAIRAAARAAISKHGIERTPANPGMADLDRLAILVEEVGEVARTLTYDQNRASLERELLDVAAVAAMWVDGLNPHTRRAEEEDVAPVDHDAPELDAIEARAATAHPQQLRAAGAMLPDAPITPTIKAAIEAAIRVAKTDVPELVAEVRRLRARVADDDALADERDWWRDHTRQLRHALTEVLGRIVEHTPGIGLCRSSWISAETVTRWREVAAAALDAAPPGQPVEVLEDATCRRIWAAALRWTAPPGMVGAFADWIRSTADRIESGELSPWEQEAPADPPSVAVEPPAAPRPAPGTPEASSGADGLILGRALCVRRGVYRSLFLHDENHGYWTRQPGSRFTRKEIEQAHPEAREVLLVDPSAAAILEAAASAAADVERMEGRRTALADRDQALAEALQDDAEADARQRAEERAEAATAPLKAALADLRQRLRSVEQQQAAELADDPAADGCEVCGRSDLAQQDPPRCSRHVHQPPTLAELADAYRQASSAPGWSSGSPSGSPAADWTALADLCQQAAAARWLDGGTEQEHAALDQPLHAAAERLAVRLETAHAPVTGASRCIHCGAEPTGRAPKPTGDGPGWQRAVIEAIADNGRGRWVSPSDAAQLRALLADRDDTETAWRAAEVSADFWESISVGLRAERDTTRDERDRLTKEAEDLRVALAEGRATAQEWAGTADRATVRAVGAEHERDQAREAIGKLERHSARLAADLDQAHAELAAVDEQLRQAGIEHPLGHHGVQDLRMRCEFHGELWELAGRLATLVASLVDTTSRPSQLRAVEVAELVADARRAGLLPDEMEAGDG